jgi:hypothetical protein
MVGVCASHERVRLLLSIMDKTVKAELAVSDVLMLDAAPVI